MSEVKYPDITVQLVGQNGNAFNLMGIVSGALRKHGIEKTVINEFMSEAMSGSYKDLLRTCCRWVNCE